MTEPLSPLYRGWAKYADAKGIPKLALTDDMVSFMAGASIVIAMVLDASKAAKNGDVSAVMRQLREDMTDFAEFMAEWREGEADE